MRKFELNFDGILANTNLPLLQPALAALDQISIHPLFLAVKRGLTLVLPLVVMGSFVLLLRNFPSPEVQKAIDAFLGEPGRQLCDALIASSFGIASLALVCALSGVSALYVNQNNTTAHISPLMATVVVLSCYFIMLSPLDEASLRAAFSMDRGLLLAMCVAVAGSGIFLRLSRVRLLRLPLDLVGHDPVVRDVFAVMPAAIATMLVFGLFKGVLVVSGVTDPHGAVRALIALPFAHSREDLAFGVLYSAASQILWFFGAYGPNLLNSVEESILVPAGLANMAAVAAGASPEHVFTKAFFDAFTRMGGSGGTLSLILVILLKSRDRGIRRLCLFAMLPALCNVNEPLLFGIPLVLNPVYAIPFVLVPILQTLAAYAATVLDLVPRTVASATWTTPALLSGYLTTQSASGVVMQCVNLGLGMLVYLPFVKMSDAIRVKQGRRVMQGLYKVAVGGGQAQATRRCMDLRARWGGCPRRSPATFRGAWPARISCTWSTSRSWTARAGGCWAWRPCCAGGTPPTGRSRRR